MASVKEQVRKLKGYSKWNPDTSWVASNRAALLRALPERRVATEKADTVSRVRSALHIFLPRSLAVTLRPMVTVALVALLTASGWIASVSASYNSVPGDVLYNVKLATEKTQAAVVSVAGSKEQKAQLHLEFATRRAQEVKEVVKQNTATPKETTNADVSTAIESLKKSITVASDSVKDVSEKTPEKSIELVKNVNEKTNAIVLTLNEVSKETAVANDVQLTKEVVETTKVVNDVGIKAVEEVVQKQSSGDLVASKEEVQNLVSQKIDTVLKDSKASGDTIAQVTLPVPIVTSTPVVLLVPTSTAAAVASTTKEIANAVQKVNEKTVAVEGTLKEAKQLVQNGELVEAMQKVKEANQVTQEAKQVVVEAQKAVKEIIPDVQVVKPVDVTSGTTRLLPSVTSGTQPIANTQPTNTTTIPKTR